MSAESLSRTLAAIADPTRRAILKRLGARDAQRRPCRLRARPLREAADWIEAYRSDWEELRST